MKQKTSNWTIVSYTIGFFVIVFFDVRYLWIFDDMSAAMWWTYVGLSICGFGWLYNKFLEIDKRLNKLSEILDEKLTRIAEEFDLSLNNKVENEKEK